MWYAARAAQVAAHARESPRARSAGPYRDCAPCPLVVRGAWARRALAGSTPRSVAASETSVLTSYGSNGRHAENAPPSRRETHHHRRIGPRLEQNWYGFGRPRVVLPNPRHAQRNRPSATSSKPVPCHGWSAGSATCTCVPVLGERSSLRTVPRAGVLLAPAEATFFTSNP